MKTHGFKQRILDPLKSTLLPKVILFTDSETVSEPEGVVEVQVFRLGWVLEWHSAERMEEGSYEASYYDNSERYCEAFELAARKHKKVMIIGHNIFFDLQCAGFFRYFTRRGWALEWLYDQGVTYILRIKYNDISIMAISSTNYYDCSLKDLGEMIGLKKQEIDLDDCNQAELKKYCRRDTEIVMYAIWYYIRFVRENRLGRMTLTKSSQSMTAYRTRFMRKKIHLHSEERAFALERAGYMGGRTEAYHIGEVSGEGFLSMDVNGMYPYVMASHRYPVKMVCLMEGEPMHRYTELLGRWGMIAEVELDTPEPAFALRRNYKLIFPTGRFVTHLCTEGLKYALSKGYVIRILRASVYLMDDLFGDYVAYFQDLRTAYRSQGNDVMAQLCKYMHNCLYGKWAQREIITDMRDNPTGQDYLRREIWDAVNGGWYMETYLMNKILMQHWEGEAHQSFPAIAAHITENARLKLWEIIRGIGPDRVLYCDTDSVIIRESDLDRVAHPFGDTVLGALKICDRFDYLRIDGAKNYRSDDSRHIKGIPQAALEVSDGVFVFDSFDSQTACLRAGMDVGVTITPVVRRLVHRYDKGIVGEDGRVRPYRLSLSELPV